MVYETKRSSPPSIVGPWSFEGSIITIRILTLYEGCIRSSFSTEDTSVIVPPDLVRNIELDMVSLDMNHRLRNPYDSHLSISSLKIDDRSVFLTFHALISFCIRYFLDIFVTAGCSYNVHLGSRYQCWTWLCCSALRPCDEGLESQCRTSHIRISGWL